MVTSQEQDAASTMERCLASLTQAPLLPPPTPRLWVALTLNLGRSYITLPL